MRARTWSCARERRYTRAARVWRFGRVFIFSYLYRSACVSRYDKNKIIIIQIILLLLLLRRRRNWCVYERVREKFGVRKKKKCEILCARVCIARVFQQMSYGTLAAVSMTRQSARVERVGLKECRVCVRACVCVRGCVRAYVRTSLRVAPRAAGPYTPAATTSLNIARLRCARAAHAGVRKWVIRVGNMYIYVREFFPPPPYPLPHTHPFYFLSPLSSRTLSHCRPARSFPRYPLATASLWFSLSLFLCPSL